MAEASTVIGKLIFELVQDHPGWSATRIAREIDKSRPDLVDDLFGDRRWYILRWWVSNAVGEHRRKVRDKLKTGEIFAALSPDGKNRLVTIGEMTGSQAVVIGERYLASGERLTQLGYTYIEIGTHAGRKKIKNVYTRQELERLFRSQEM